MRTLFKLSIIFPFIMSVFITPLYAVEIKDRNEYLIDARGDDGDIYLNRFSIHKKLALSDVELSLFGETQLNLDTNESEKLLLGIEAIKSIWKFLYLSQSVQLISGEMLDYMVFDTDSKSIDTTTQIGLNILLLEHFSFSIFEAYSLNLEKGRGEYCEVGAEISFTAKKLYSIAMGWRHTDRIHTLDTDYVSSSITLRF